jgi:hypothetical protein
VSNTLYPVLVAEVKLVTPGTVGQAAIDVVGVDWWFWFMTLYYQGIALQVHFEVFFLETTAGDF